MGQAGEWKDLWERETRTAMEDVDSDMEFPFSIYIYEAPLRPGGKAHWNEVLRADWQQWAIYAAGLIHNAGVPHQKLDQDMTCSYQQDLLQQNTSEWKT